MDAPVGAPVPPGWYPDPTWTQVLRYWDGRSWTPWVAQRPSPPAPPHPTIPLAAGVGASPRSALSLVASRYVLRWLAGFGWPIAVYVAIAGLLGYGPVMLFCWWASQSVGTAVAAGRQRAVREVERPRLGAGGRGCAC